MRGGITFLFFSIVFTCLAVDVSIKNTHFTDRVFHGTIDNKYPITIYLKYVNNAPDHRFTHSVKGWYWYDNIKQKIPLVGIWDGDLTLYQFENAAARDSIVNFIPKDESNFRYSEILDELKSKINFTEKFVILRQEGLENSKWVNTKTELSVQIDEQDLQINRHIETLEIGYDDVVYTTNISQFTPYDRSFTLEEFKVEKDEIRVLLSFDYSSRGYRQTMCGGGSEMGYVLLTYNRDMDLLSIKRALIESCNYDIYVIKEETDGRFENKFYYVSGEDIPDRVLAIDRSEVTMRIE
jgi:hypothetical protein